MKALLFDKAFIEVQVKYSDYNNIFLAGNIAKLLKNSKINKHAIKLKKSKQPFFRSIYSLGPAKLEMLKTYIKTKQANSFIWSFKYLARPLILFD